MEPGGRLIRALLTFVIGGAVALVLATTALVWLLVGRRHEVAPPSSPLVASLPVPAGFRATAATLGDGRILLLGTDATNRQVVVLADPRNREAVTVLTLEPR